MDTDIDTIMEADMEKKEIIEMIVDMDRIGDFVRRQMAIMPTESREKAEAAAKCQAVKYALVKLLDEHDQKIKGLTDRIQARAEACGRNDRIQAKADLMVAERRLHEAV